MEDEAFALEALKMSLTNLGYKISGDAINAQEAIQTLEKGETDLAFLDIRIQGDQDGIWVAEQIRTRFKIPFIFLTSQSDQRTMKDAIRTKPHGYLVKPFNEAELFASIELAIKNFNGTEAEADIDTHQIEDDAWEADSVFLRETPLGLCKSAAW